jgi:hypothetical protein
MRGKCFVVMKAVLRYILHPRVKGTLRIGRKRSLGMLNWEISD